MWSYTYTTYNQMPYLVSVATPNTDASTAKVNYDLTTGRAMSLVDAKGNVRYYTYGFDGTTVSIRSNTGTETDSYMNGFDDGGRLASSTNAAGNSTSVTWQGGDILAVMPPSEPGVTIVRDAVGNPTTITYPHGNKLNLTWIYPDDYPFGQLTQTQEVGSDGHTKSPTLFDYYTTTTTIGDGGALRGYLSRVTTPNLLVINYTYTQLGDVLNVQTSAADGSTINTQYVYKESSGGWLNQYELIGKPRKIIDPNGNITSFPNQSYNIDMESDVTDALGNTGHLSLNHNFQPVSVNVSGRVTNFNYFNPGKPLTSAYIRDNNTGYRHRI